MSVLRKVSTQNDRRAYFNLKTGLAYHSDLIPKFVTLTCMGPEYRLHMHAFRKCVRRNYGEMEYFATRTGEGRGVYHLIVYCRYIPYDVLSDYWRDLGCAPMVSISCVYACYCFGDDLSE